MRGYSSEELQNSSSGYKSNGGSAPLLKPRTSGERAIVGHGSPSEVAKVEHGNMKHGGMVGKHGNMPDMKMKMDM